VTAERGLEQEAEGVASTCRPGADPGPPAPSAARWPRRPRGRRTERHVRQQARPANQVLGRHRHGPGHQVGAGGRGDGAAQPLRLHGDTPRLIRVAGPLEGRAHQEPGQARRSGPSRTAPARSGRRPWRPAGHGPAFHDQTTRPRGYWTPSSSRPGGRGLMAAAGARPRRASGIVAGAAVGQRLHGRVAHPMAGAGRAVDQQGDPVRVQVPVGDLPEVVRVQLLDPGEVLARPAPVAQRLPLGQQVGRPSAVSRRRRSRASRSVRTRSSSPP
jgi:hypothetical protein